MRQESRRIGNRTVGQRREAPALHEVVGVLRAACEADEEKRRPDAVLVLLRIILREEHALVRMVKGHLTSIHIVVMASP